VTAITEKPYRCRRCGYLNRQKTNHYGPTWSFGHFNTCPQCPPWAKYPEFGGNTIWDCAERDPKEMRWTPTPT
jgi:ssDNA-binding Zn-finger/Zn-ribbon topoisomerase 1